MTKCTRVGKSIVTILGIVVTGFAAGCGGGGGSGGPSVDFDALHAQYLSPTGSVKGADLSTVKGALDKQSTASSIPVEMNARAGIRLQAVPASGVRIQGGTGSVACSGGGESESCTCPGGGSFSVSGASDQGGVEEATVDYSSCIFSDSSSAGTATDSISGDISFADYTTSPTMLIYSGTLQVTLTPPGTTESVDLNYALVNGMMTYSVDISSGNVLVQETGTWDSSTDSGSFTLVDKSGSWSCTFTNGTGTCTGPGGTISG
jgi:hypothetical protein